jgi:gamma-tubulin complex component 2
VNNWESLLIRNTAEINSKQPIQFGASVVIITKNEGVLVPQENGGVSIVYPGKSSSMIEGLLSAGKLAISDAHNQLSRRSVFPFDDVVLKTTGHKFLCVDADGLLKADSISIDEDSTWKVMDVLTPPVPEWVYLRPFTSLNYLNPQFQQMAGDKLAVSRSFPAVSTTPKLSSGEKPLGAHTTQEQEYLIIEDLLYCMMSIEGTYIKRQLLLPDKTQFEYVFVGENESPQADVSLRQMAKKILPICKEHDRLRVYIATHSNYEFGSVAQAFCASLSAILRELLVLVNQLDAEFTEGNLTLQKFWFYIQPSFQAMEMLGSLVEEAKLMRGGEIMNAVLRKMQQAGDPKLHDILRFLLLKCFWQYMNIFGKWLYHGIVEDNFNEFMIVERRDLTKELLSTNYKENYWDQRFALLKAQVPMFFEKHVDQVLLTGKYINVLRDSSKNIECPFSSDLLENYEKYIDMQ